MNPAPLTADCQLTPSRESLASATCSFSSGVTLDAVDAVQCEVGWQDGDHESRIKGQEILKGMHEMGWRTISALGLQPWDKRWTATMYLPRNMGYASDSQRELLDASLADYRGHADHVRMQWLTDQSNWPMVGLKIDKAQYGPGPNIRAVIDDAMTQTNNEK